MQQLKKRIQTSFTRSLKTRMMFWFIVISLIPILIFLIFSYSLIQRDAEKEITTRLDSAKKVALQEIERLVKLSLDYSILISSNPQLRDAVLRKDHLKTVQIISPLATELSIHQIIVTDDRGVVIGRSDILSQYGQNMKDSYLVRCGLARLKYTDVECQDGTVYVRSVSDIVTGMTANNMRVIGTIIVGYKLDQRFVENIKQLTKMEVVLFPLDLSTITASSKIENQINREFVQKIFSGDYEFIKTASQKGSYHYVIIPVRKNEKLRPAGALALVMKNGMVSNFIKASLRFSALLFAVTLWLVVLISLFVSSRITKPIVELAEGAKKVAKGNFDIQLRTDNNSSDEISLLTQEFLRMVKNVQSYATNIEETLNTTQQYVDRLSKIASDSAKTSQITSEQIKEVSALAESQKEAFEQTAQMLYELENQIQKMFDIFKVVQNEVSAVYSTTLREQDSIKMLINHMYSANSAINDVALELKKATEDYRRIARTSQDISNLADRIKIVALNASIEASKRGIPTFEIIASEVSRLSQSANMLAKSIVEAIEAGLCAFNTTAAKLEETVKLMESGVEVARRSQKSLSRIETTNHQIKSKIESVIEAVSNQQEKIFTINNVLKNQTQTVSQYFKTLASIKDIFQNQKRTVDRLIDQFSEVHREIVKLASISMGAEKEG